MMQVKQYLKQLMKGPKRLGLPIVHSSGYEADPGGSKSAIGWQCAV